MVSRLAILLVLLAGACAGAAPVPSTTTPAWLVAHKLAKRLLAAKYKAPRRIYEAIPGVRFLFVAEVDDRVRNNSMVLIHRGTIFEDRGLKALGRYMRDVDFLRGPRPSIRSMSSLWVHVFSPSWDKGTVESAPHWGSISGHDKLAPKLTWTRDEAVFTLFYWLPEPRHPGDESKRFGPPPPRDVLEWQVVIPSSYKLYLRKKKHQYDTKKKQFVKP